MGDTFEQWKLKADRQDLLEAAVRYGAVFKKVGREHIGPCPACGGHDRFSINTMKHKWHCRGHGGGHGAISMVMHIAGLSYLQSCQALTGEALPQGAVRAKAFVEAKAHRQNQERHKQERQEQERQEHNYQHDTKDAALAIWTSSQLIADTPAQTYLNSRGIVLDQYPDVLRFHPSLPYPGKAKKYPVLVCRVDDVAGELTAIWRIYLRGDGRKADVESAKLGLGPAGGGAVRIGGTAPRIAIAEGVETALAYWLLIDQRYPVWAALSTSGMAGFEVPLKVEHLEIVPDGDQPIRKCGSDFVPACPAGRKAATARRDRALAEGIGSTIVAEPPPTKDYGDLWLERMGEVA